MIIVIYGAEASGKMTIGQELEKDYGFHLLYNHQVIDLVGTIFDKEHIGTSWTLKNHHIDLITAIYEKFLLSALDNDEDLVFTITWNFDNDNFRNFFFELQEYAKRRKSCVLFVELFSTLEERIKRNDTPNRLKHKTCKRDINKSTKELIESTRDLRLSSKPGEMDFFNHYMYVDNTNLLPCEVAKKIIEYIMNNC